MSTSSTDWVPQTAEGRYYSLDSIKDVLKATFPTESEADFKVSVGKAFLWTSKS
jgi:hypothetical protein